MFGRSGRQGTPEALGANSDQVLLDLVNGLREVNERIQALDRRFEALGTAAEPDEDALMETQLHVARLSAELSRLTVELRGEIAELGNRTRLVVNDDGASPKLAGDESFEDLTADSPARAPTTPRSSGWQPSA